MDDKEELMDEQSQGGIVPQTPEAEAVGEPQQPRTFLQEDVDAIAGKARSEGRDSALKALYERYGVSGEDELSDLFVAGQSYPSVNQSCEELRRENATLKERVALLDATLNDGLDPSAYEDVVAISKSKGLDITPENIRSLIEQRPYWRKGGAQAQASEPAPAPTPAPIEPQAPIEQNPAAQEPQPQPKDLSIVRKLGSQPHPKGGSSSISPEDMAKRLAGVGPSN